MIFVINTRHDTLLQVVEDGYEFFARRQLVTLFSAPNYCGEFDNAGGMMTVDDSLMCSFQVSRLRTAYFIYIYCILLSFCRYWNHRRRRPSICTAAWTHRDPQHRNAAPQCWRPTRRNNISIRFHFLKGLTSKKTTNNKIEKQTKKRNRKQK